MRKIAIIILLTFFAVSSYSKSIQAYLSFNTFYSKEKGSYVETYLAVSGASATFVKNKNGKFQASIEVSFSFSQDSVVKFKDRYNLLSQELNDTSNVNFNFLDQQRINLPNGNYDFKVAIADNNNRQEPFEAENKVVLNYNDTALAISDIQLLESYKKTDSLSRTAKSGYEMIPYVNNFYAKDVNTLNFYTEIYNSDKVLRSEPFLVKYYIESYNKKLPIGELSAFSKQTPKAVNPVLANFPLSNLPSGNYFLVLEVRNKENILLAEKKLFFQRSNIFELSDSSIAANISLTFAGQYVDKDTLGEYIKSLRPIASEIEKDFIDNQLKTADVSSMQIYFYSFWQKRNKKNPAKEWGDYAISVTKVNNSFGSKVLRIKGYDTDRGRVYLKYGAPNTITPVLNDQEAYPYIIWHYFKIKGQSNRKFIFCNRDLITDDFNLIHSDANGETNDPRWQYKVFERTKMNRNLDENSVGDSKINENIKNPH